MAAEWQSTPGEQPQSGDTPIRVYSCGRIGMQANPPRRRLLLRRRR